MAGNAAEAREVAGNSDDIKTLKAQEAKNAAGHDSNDQAINIFA